MPDRGHHPHFSLGSDTEPTPAGAVYPPEPSPTLINHAGEGYRNGSFGVRDGILKERTGDGEQTTSYPPATSSTDHTSSIKKAWLRLPPVPAFLAWAPPHNNWKGWRPVIRATVAAWCGLLLLLGKESGKTLGQASFLTLVVAAFCPASNPIATVIEQTILQALLVTLSWAWASLALFIAHESRTLYKLPAAEFTEMASAPYLAQNLTAAQVTLAVSEDIFHGTYLEVSSSVVCGVFLATGGGFLLWLRGHLGPGPALFGIIFAVLQLVITLTIGVLFPYGYYAIGLVFYLPFACQLAINLAVTLLVFPETLAHQFSDRLIDTLTPLQKVIQQQKGMLRANPRTEEWLEFKSIKVGVNGAMGGITLLSASETNLTREISYARISGKDLSRIFGHMRILVGRSTGFVSFYEIVEKHLHREYSDAKGGPTADALVIRLGHSRPGSPEHTPTSSRPPSPTREHDTPPTSPPTSAHRPSSRPSSADHSQLHMPTLSPLTSPLHAPIPSPLYISTSRNSYAFPGSSSAPPSRNSSSNSLADLGRLEEEAEDAAADSEREREREVEEVEPSELLQRLHKKRARSHREHGAHKSVSHLSLPNVLQEVLHPQTVRPVGVVESQRYMDLEDYLSNPRDEEHIEDIIALLSSASDDLLSTLDTVVAHLIATIHSLKSSDRPWAFWATEDPTLHASRVAASAASLASLEKALEEYRDTKRLDVVRPFASLFDPAAPRERWEAVAPSHRGLFWAFSYQFSLMGWAEALADVAKETYGVEEKRRRPRIWTPDWAKLRWSGSADDTAIEDENPDMIAGLRPGMFNAPRNPDYKPPKSSSQVLGIKIYDAFQLTSRADVLFGVKSAILLGLISLPAYFPATSYFFYRQRGVWVLIMSALTSTQFIGDTTFGFVVRVFGTFVGAAVGLLIWTIGAGRGRGNAYGIAAASAVFFPLVMFYRVHFTPPITAILPTVTAMLVVGYSWQDANAPTLSSVGWGWGVAWRRFVCVMIGITAAFLWSYVPPKVTQKETVRRTYAKVLREMGGVVCQLLSFSNTKSGVRRPPKSIIANISALRAKVAKTTASKNMIRYEVSLRGPWPANNYASLQALQLELLDLFAQLLGVVASLDTKWTKALLHRTQFSNTRFLAELLTSFQLLGTSLETGTPLPMLYNPLLERYLKPTETIEAGHPYGFDATLDNHAIEGIPQHVDLATICSLEYLRFSCGISLCYAIVNRMDRLMFVTKSLVGESYIVYGLEEEENRRAGPSSSMEKGWGGDDSRRSSMDPERIV